MNRRRLCWLCAALLLVGGAVVAWYVLAARDSDFHVIGPKTRGVRANLALLDTNIDVADFHDCKTVRAALNRLRSKLHKADPKPVPLPDLRPNTLVWDWIDWDRPIYIDVEAFAREGTPNIAERAVHYAEQSQTMTAKEFLRLTFRQTDAPGVHFIVRGHNVEVTTSEQAQEARTRYLDSVSAYDRMRNLWKEMTGTIEDDPIVYLVD